MKKVLLIAFLVVAPYSSANAWYDAYGGFTCGYLDPLTSVLDSIFGPPCPAPVPVAVPAPVPVPVAPMPAPVAVRGPVAVPVPMSYPAVTFPGPRVPFFW